MSNLVLRSLQMLRCDAIPVLESIKLSPPFYYPENLILLTKVWGKESREFLELAAQFNSLDAQMQLPKFKTRLIEYFSRSQDKINCLNYVKILLQEDDSDGAIQILENTKHFGWPETQRYHLV